METVAEAVESSKNRSIPGWGQTGQGGVMRHRRVPSRHHIPPTVIHLEAGSRVALAGPSEAFARASKAGERERKAVRRQHSRVSSGGEWGAAGVGLQGDFNSKEAAVGSACRHTIPTWHCGPGTGAERAHSGLGALYALTAQPLGLAWQTELFQGSQGHRMKPDKARQAGQNG